MQSKDHVTHTVVRWYPKGPLVFSQGLFGFSPYNAQEMKQTLHDSCRRSTKRCQKERVFHLHASEHQRRTKDHQVQARSTSDHPPRDHQIIMRSCHDQKLTTCLGVYGTPTQKCPRLDLGRKAQTHGCSSVGDISVAATHAG